MHTIHNIQHSRPGLISCVCLVLLAGISSLWIYELAEAGMLISNSVITNSLYFILPTIILSLFIYAFLLKSFTTHVSFILSLALGIALSFILTFIF